MKSSWIPLPGPEHTARIDKLWAKLQADPRFNTEPPGPDDPTAIMF